MGGSDGGGTGLVVAGAEQPLEGCGVAGIAAKVAAAGQHGGTQGSAPAGVFNGRASRRYRNGKAAVGHHASRLLALCPGSPPFLRLSSTASAIPKRARSECPL